MVHDIYNLIHGCLRLLRSPLDLKLRLRIAVTFIRLRLKNRYFTWTGRAPNEETILGRRIRFFRYSTMIYLFEEIFIEQSYSFRATRPNPIIIDAGANIGMSILFLKELYPAAHIIAYEPDPETFKALKSNIERNGISGVELHNQALLDRDGEIDFQIDAVNPGSPGMSTLEERRGIRAPKTLAVPCVSFSSQLGDKIDFLKMDVEGAEAACLLEAARSGQIRKIEQMIIECHHNAGREGSLRGVLHALEDSGFTTQVSANAKAPYAQNQPQDVHVYAFQP